MIYAIAIIALTMLSIFAAPPASIVFIIVHGLLSASMLAMLLLQARRAKQFFREHTNIAPRTEALLKRFYSHITKGNPHV